MGPILANVSKHSANAHTARARYCSIYSVHFSKYTWLMAAGLHELGRIHFRIYPSQLFDQWETGIRSSINLLECGRHAEMMKIMETDRLRYNRSR